MGRFPTFDESTVLSSGNPQAISGTSEARIRGEANSLIGQHVAKMGELIAGEEAEAGVNRAKEIAANAQVHAEKTSRADGSNFEEIFSAKYQEDLSQLKSKMDPLALGKASTRCTQNRSQHRR